ncbi:hypothetical protein [Geomobilimonas luticola]|uniref:HTH Mu-type domain-containing protein n=1 Tax=Geomobilimonas luticola TaxID=1114878 RepID=A0ABS5SES5_9BACT|nr:hypothetical protein [Geomobilimonas luticola]MBT0653875.1 hypothetical protein [Geomobilimonas luticola]
MKLKTWHTAQEIADIKLPGIPTSKNGVLDRAKREKWPFRPYRGHGKGKEFPLSVVLLGAQLDEMTPEIRDRLITTIDQLEVSHKAAEDVLERLRQYLRARGIRR